MAEIPGNITAAVSAVSRGELTQIRIIVENIYEQLEKMRNASSEEDNEKMKGEEQSKPDFSAIEPVDPPADDAKSVETRDAVIELTESYNRLLGILKGSK